jgi:murein DD-endopeptidase MepM/ murein hydrolase activator NlpD
MRRRLGLGGALFLSATLASAPAFSDDSKKESPHDPIPFPELPEGPVSVLPSEAPLGQFTFAWPLENVQINSHFGMRRDPVRKKRKKAKVKLHAGVDLEGKTGDTIIAAGPGRVLHAGWHSGYGNYILIQHDSGYLTHYGHLSEVLVYRGQVVRQGAPVGLVGNTGHSTGPHLHFGVTKDGKWLNPVTLIGKSSSGKDDGKASSAAIDDEE